MKKLTTLLIVALGALATLAGPRQAPQPRGNGTRINPPSPPRMQQNHQKPNAAHMRHIVKLPTPPPPPRKIWVPREYVVTVGTNGVRITTMIPGHWIYR